MKKIFLFLFAVFFLSGTTYPQSFFPWAKRASCEFKRNKVEALTFSDKIFISGGWEGSGSQLSRRLSIYSPAQNTWSEGAAMSSGRYGHAFIEISGLLYVFGGEGPFAGSWNNKVEVYNPATNTWTTKNNWSSPRNDVAWGVIADKAYLAGGRTGYGASVATVQRYDPATDTWTTVAPLLQHRMAAAGAVVDGKFYVIGGVIKQNESSNEFTKLVEMYNPATNSWSYKAPLPNAFWILDAVVKNGKIFVLGSLSGDDYKISQVYVYDPNIDTWEVLSTDGNLSAGGAFTMFNEKTYYIAPFYPPSTISGETYFTVLDQGHRYVSETKISLKSGVINGSSEFLTTKTIIVDSIQSISGTLVLQTTNSHSASSVTPLIGTPSWGGHSSSYWGINSWIGTGTNEYSTNINLPNPQIPGVYYIFFAATYDIGYPATASLTNYTGTPVWDDGVDVADWNDLQAKMAIDSGYTRTLYRAGNQYSILSIAGAAIKVVVTNSTGGANPELSIPSAFTLSQNYPNPFNPSSRINYSLPYGCEVTIKLYDVLGNEVKILASGYKEDGSHTLQLEMSELPSGVYIYQMNAGSFITSKKLMLIK